MEIKTNQDQGSNTLIYKAPVRNLTAGEISMLKLIFKDSFDYSRAKIHGNRFIPILQDVPMTPKGETYYVPKDYQPDYSISPLKIKVTDYIELYQKNTFIHEMVHIWQYQHGQHVAVKAAAIHLCNTVGICNDPYLYKLESNADLGDYGVEQQAQIIADYHSLCSFRNRKNIGHILGVNNKEIHFALGKLSAAKADAEVRTPAFNQYWLNLYQIVLRKFLSNPGSYKW